MNKYKEELLESLLKLDEHGLMKDSHGNISILSDDNKYVIIKPSGVHPKHLKIEDISVVLVNTLEKIDGKLKPSVDLEHHVCIYKKSDYRIRSIVHTHQEFATAFAMTRWGIDVYCTEHADYFGKKIECLRYGDCNEWSKNIDDKHLNEKVLLLEKHGALSFGENSNDAIKNIFALEMIAKKTFMAIQINKLLYDKCLYPMSNSEINKWHERYVLRYGQ